MNYGEVRMSKVAERAMKEWHMRIDVSSHRESYNIPADFDLSKLNFEELEYIISKGDATEILKQKN